VTNAYVLLNGVSFLCDLFGGALRAERAPLRAIELQVQKLFRAEETNVRLANGLAVYPRKILIPCA